ncbi:hypothetical protein EC2788150_5579 [Escherichia coli 2788150]|nr:hypothetical protein EC2788150_5579 [Escherichia coli 2788150]
MTAWCFCCHACRLASSAVLKRAERLLTVLLTVVSDWRCQKSIHVVSC